MGKHHHPQNLRLMFSQKDDRELLETHEQEQESLLQQLVGS